MVLGFLEYNISLNHFHRFVCKITSKVKVFIFLPCFNQQAMAADKRALDRLPSISANTASYKLRHGLAKTFCDLVKVELKTCHFSLNIDEAMSKTNKKVLAILTSHFSPSQNRIVVHHFAAMNIVRVSSETLFKEVTLFMTKHGFDWNNLTSVLMDSCRVMRGSKSGLETLLRKEAPHLLDIDGDTCHHANNAAVQFCKPFQRHVESMLTDLHTEFQYSTGLRDTFYKFCTALQIKATKPEQYASHRWLSVLDVSVDTLRLWDAIILYTASFIMMKDLPDYQEVIDEVLERREVSDKGKRAVKSLQEALKKKWSSFTSHGKDRKLRLVKKVFEFHDQTLILLHTYISALSLLKEYVLFFQKREPVVHRLHDKQVDLLKDFLACFVTPASLQTPDLTKIDLDNKKNLLPGRHLTVGTTASKLMSKQSKEIKISIRDKLLKGFVSCGKYLQTKMPVNNETLQICSMLDPVVRRTSVARKLLLKIPEKTNLLPKDPETCDKFQREINRYTSDPCPSRASEEDPVDVWWGAVSQERYPLLTAAAKGLLSCFHGPIVESSFSEMSDVLCKQKSNMDIETYMAIQTVKSTLAAKKQTAVQYFAKADPVKEPVSKVLVDNMKKAWIGNEARKMTNKESREQEKEKLGVETTTPVPSKVQEKQRILHTAAKEREVPTKKRKAHDIEEEDTVQEEHHAAASVCIADDEVQSVTDVTPTPKPKVKQAKLDCFFK